MATSPTVPLNTKIETKGDVEPSTILEVLMQARNFALNSYNPTLLGHTKRMYDLYASSRSELEIIINQLNDIFHMEEEIREAKAEAERQREEEEKNKDEDDDTDTDTFLFMLTRYYYTERIDERLARKSLINLPPSEELPPANNKDFTPSAKTTNTDNVEFLKRLQNTTLASLDNNLKSIETQRRLEYKDIQSALAAIYQQIETLAGLDD